MDTITFRLPYQEYEINSQSNLGLYGKWNPTSFDGITCKDDNMVFQSQSTDSFIEIDTGTLDNFTVSNLTLEFWAKISDDSWN